ncbi:hypothetical protein [Pontiella sulfatireligans]|uniref:Uncharacterized protein n=1 Tax=Pontiella sulfatireligans TaxID=2750658 RepID=A0A6C2UL94_9BACT|nr:hypothetical protein [Pontiella sulfatireligans]VGO19956.1 hypothetical protein SCARR_02016 [Pontiella sulfatireligans]
MKMKKTKCITLAALLAAMVGLTCKADESEPKLQLHGKTLMVYPVLMEKEGTPNSDSSWKFGVVVGKNTAALIEEYGMHPDISTEGPDSIADEDSLAAMENKFRTFLAAKKVESDYSLFARFRLGRSKHGPRIIRSCAMLADSSGQIVWSEEQTEFPEEYSPMHGMMGLINAVHSASDLKEPDWENRKSGPFARRMQQESGLPSVEEYEAMDARFEAAQESFKEATLTIYPFRIWKQAAGSATGAEVLAKKLNDAGIFKSALAAETDTRLIAKRDPDSPGQPSIIAASARDFSKYLKEHPPATDYALLADVTVPVHHVHLVLCDKSGVWLHFNIANSHHDDYRKLKPKTVEDCAELAFGRLTARINEQKEQEGLDEAIAAYKPDPRHFGKYIDKNGYVELKPNGSFLLNAKGHEMQGTYAVVEGNTLVLTFPGRRSRPIGKLEEGKLIHNDGDVSIKQ